MDTNVPRIDTEAEYDRALAQIDTLMHVVPGTPDGDRIHVLVTRVEEYEARRWPIKSPA